MASYPTSLAQFLVYQDQPGDANHMVVTGTDPATGLPIQTDVTIDSAHITDQIHGEVIAIESTIGVRPFTTPGKTTLGASVVDLYLNKVDINHNHPHYSMHNLVYDSPGAPLALGTNKPPSIADDHKLYPMVNGSRGFTAPVSAPAATEAHHLVNLSQIQGRGVTAGQMKALVNAAFDSNTVRGPVAGQTLRIQGGQTWGYSDENGNLWVSFNPPFNALMSFVYVKLPFPGESMLGWYQYQYIEDQLILMELNNSGALIQFIEDIRVDARALVAVAWTAIGT